MLECFLLIPMFSFVYTDESTGKEETVDVVSGLIAGFTKLKKDGKDRSY